MNPATGIPFGLDERETIDLYVVDDDRQIVRCLYSKNGRMVVDEKGAPLSSVRPGEKVRLFGSSRTPMVTGRTADLTLQPLSAYDCLRSKLMQIQAREGEAWDGKCIRIAAESPVWIFNAGEHSQHRKPVRTPFCKHLWGITPNC